MFKTVEDVSIKHSNGSTMTRDESTQSCRRSIIRDFCLNTTTHGVSSIARSQSIHNCVFWSISFAVSTTVMFYFVVEAILAYFKYPTNIDVRITTEWPQYFPAVSLCNAAPSRSDRFVQPFLNYVSTQNLTNRTNVTTISSEEANYIWSFIIDQLNRNESIVSTFFSLSSMLVACSFNNRQCSDADFIPFLSSAYGLCYTFNARMKNSENNSVRYTNQDAGNGVLSLALYLHSHQYIPHIRNSE